MGRCGPELSRPLRRKSADWPVSPAEFDPGIIAVSDSALAPTRSTRKLDLALEYTNAWGGLRARQQRDKG